MTESVSFERAAAFYDRTRVTDPRQLASTLDLLDRTLPAGHVLEIGVGTGALAVPLADRGRPVTGIDLSEGMLDRLRGRTFTQPVRLALADALHLPFVDDAFRGAYCRWVLHLVADWPAAVGELCRVTEAGGTVLVEPGGFPGRWRVVYERLLQELGDDAAPVGLDLRRRYEDLDAAFTSWGATLRTVVTAPGASLDVSLDRFFSEALARSYSWTWRVPEGDLRRGIAAVRSWAVEQYGSGGLGEPFEPSGGHRWRVYDMA